MDLSSASSPSFVHLPLALLSKPCSAQINSTKLDFTRLLTWASYSFSSSILSCPGACTCVIFQDYFLFTNQFETNNLKGVLGFWGFGVWWFFLSQKVGWFFLSQEVGWFFFNLRNNHSVYQCHRFWKQRRHISGCQSDGFLDFRHNFSVYQLDC